MTAVNRGFTVHSDREAVFTAFCSSLQRLLLVCFTQLSSVEVAETNIIDKMPGKTGCRKHVPVLSRQFISNMSKIIRKFKPCLSTVRRPSHRVGYPGSSGYCKYA